MELHWYNVLFSTYLIVRCFETANTFLDDNICCAKSYNTVFITYVASKSSFDLLCTCFLPKIINFPKHIIVMDIKQIPK